MNTVKAISHYRLMWHKRGRRGSVALVMLHTDAEVHITDLDASEMLAIADLLRNERPVFWDEASQTLFTNNERVGEEEHD